MPRRSGSWSVLLAMAALSGAPSASPAQQIAGVTYTIHSTNVSTAGATNRATSWTAHVESAAGRGRMDIVDGALEPMFSKGDYLLFDGATYLVVHPGANTFSTRPDLSGKNGSQEAAALRNAMQVTDVNISLDTVATGLETVNGFRASHYRTHTTFTMSMDLPGLGAPPAVRPPSMMGDMTMDLWFAEDVEPAPGPFAVGGNSQLPSVLPGMKALSDRMLALQSALPKRLGLKQTVASRMTGAPGTLMPTVSTEATTEILDFAHRDVDATRLVLPGGYTQVPVRGLEMFAAPAPLTPDELAKWRAVPR